MRAYTAKWANNIQINPILENSFYRTERERERESARRLLDTEMEILVITCLFTDLRIK